MQRIVQNCIDGCGRQRIFKCPDGFSPIPDYDHVAELAAIAQAKIDADVQEIIRRRAQLRSDLEALKAAAEAGEDTYILVDDDPLDAVPGTWTKIKRFFLGGK